MKLSKYRLAFIAGFVVIPSVLWAVQAGPTLTKRGEFIRRQENARTVQQRNMQLPSQRDTLAEEWSSFQPVADEALRNLASDLNPHLVQKRIHGLAEELGCELRIRPKPFLEGDEAVRFQVNGEGSYASLVKLIDRLEQGQHFVRFEKLALVMPSGNYAGASSGAVRIVATLLIPPMPEGLEAVGEEELQ